MNGLAGIIFADLLTDFFDFFILESSYCLFFVLYFMLLLYLNFFHRTPLSVHLFPAIHLIDTNSNVIRFLLFQFLNGVLGFLCLYALFLFELFVQGILELVAFSTGDFFPLYSKFLTLSIFS